MSHVNFVEIRRLLDAAAAPFDREELAQRSHHDIAANVLAERLADPQVGLALIDIIEIQGSKIDEMIELHHNHHQQLQNLRLLLNSAVTALTQSMSPPRNAQRPLIGRPDE